MIKYESYSWRAFIGVKGSVIPRAAFYAILASLLSAALKFMELMEIFPMQDLASSVQGSSFNGFTMVLSLILVFRTNQAYTRFWAGATHQCDFTAELQETMSAVAAFTTVSSKPPEECQVFLHRLARLASLLHATVLQVATDIPGKEFPVMDINALRGHSLTHLKICKGEERLFIICQWIQVLIIQGMSSGVLNVPPPVLSRVFQSLEKSKCSFHQFLQIVKIPFPYPYAQATWILLGVYCIYTPCVMIWWTDSVILAFISTFLCIIGMFCVEITAGQLEHPFGDDANDLPVLEFQLEMNRFLVTLLEPLSREVPELNDDAILDHAELAEAIGEECSMAWRSLSQAPNVYSHERPQLVKKSSALAPNMPERGLACDVEPEEMRADSRVKTEDPEPDLAADVDSSLCLQEQKNEKCRLDKDVSSFFPPKAQSSSSAPEGTLRILNM